jgi:class 3 adenylate cyclase/ligand-binding sensor domain-containing protein
MTRLWLLVFMIVIQQSAWAQSEQYLLKVYNFEDGLSHRDVFKIGQDSSGFIWIATMDGLNRFDGYQFLQYDSKSPAYSIPYDATLDLLTGRNRRIWLASHDFITELQPEANRYQTIKIKPGALIRRESLVPYNLFEDSNQNIWMAVYDEKSGRSSIQRVDGNKKISTLANVEGRYPKRPIVQWGESIFVGAQPNELWQFSLQGQILRRISLPWNSYNGNQIVHLQVDKDRLWLLLSNGDVYYLLDSQMIPTPHPINKKRKKGGVFQSMQVEPNGDIWLAGLGQLWYYNRTSDILEDYDERVRQIVKSMPNYRQVFRDRSGVIWVASDYGVIKIVGTNQLFSHYLSEGNENCSNFMCSIRGMTEDDQGRIYLSYYNSIHVLDPRTNALALLFPYNDFFNFPFGLAYYDNALWTGNGLRIDLKTLKIEKILNHADEDVGVVLLDRSNNFWFGFRDRLYQYDPRRKKLQEFQDQQGIWNKAAGEISFLYQERNGSGIWVGTADRGLYRIDPIKGRVLHFSADLQSPVQLSHNRINAIMEAGKDLLWVGTANGLQRINLATLETKVYNVKQGLSNGFINGILPEGDSCIWVSTDYGLNRLSITREHVAIYYQQDGLSHNEFNRIAAFRSRNGRMYFGGLNGVNAFFPGAPFWQHISNHQAAPLLLTNYTHYDGNHDSIISLGAGINSSRQVELTHRDRFFGFTFALANFRHPAENKFSYMLEGYDEKWSAPSNVHSVRYNNIPSGSYTFRVKALTGGNVWNKGELAVEVFIQQAFYYRLDFQLLCLLFFILGLYGFLRYRIYTIRNRERVLENLVGKRTQELATEKQKSEQLLLNILPTDTAEELKKNGKALARRHENATVMFTDFKGFSLIAERLDPEKLVELVDYCFSAFDHIIDRHGLEKIKTIGDAYMCADLTDHGHAREGALRVIRAALDIQLFLKKMESDQLAKKEPFFEARIGIHTGPVVAGVVGIKKFAYDIWGDTVNIASRMESEGEAGKVNISEYTYHLIYPQLPCWFNGKYTARNKDDIDMYFVG